MTALLYGSTGITHGYVVINKLNMDMRDDISQLQKKVFNSGYSFFFLNKDISYIAAISVTSIFLILQPEFL